MTQTGYRVAGIGYRVRATSLLLVLATVGGTAGRQTPPASAAAAPATDLARRAILAAYSLDYPEATALARQGVALSPQESKTHRTVAAVLWLAILFSRGACTVDHYLGGIMKSRHSLPKPPPDLEAEFKRELDQAIALAEARLKRDPRDIEARQDAGAAYAIQASYAASVEGSVMAAYRSAKRAYDAQEEVLSHDPKRADAGFTVGVYRYIVSALSLPSRVLAYIVGFGGGKERGISLLEAAARDPLTHVDAKAALLMIYTREGRHLDALRVVRELKAEFPRNRVLVFEEGSAAIRAGLAPEAEAALTAGLAATDSDARPKFPGERAMWLFKRGLARLNQNHVDAARADLEAALENNPTGWVRGRVHVGLGKIADLAGRRADAVAAYRQARTLCEVNKDEPCAGEAGRLMKKPFKFTPPTP